MNIYGYPMSTKKQSTMKQAVSTKTRQKATRKITKLLTDRVLTEASKTAGPDATEEQVLSVSEQIMADVLDRLFPPKGTVNIPLHGTKSDLDMHTHVARTEAAVISQALKRTNGDRELAARLLGINSATLRKRLHMLREYIEY